MTESGSQKLGSGVNTVELGPLGAGLKDEGPDPELSAAYCTGGPSSHRPISWSRPLESLQSLGHDARCCPVLGTVTAKKEKC